MKIPHVRPGLLLALTCSVAALYLIAGFGDASVASGKRKRHEDSRVRRGFEIAPVPLDLHGKSRSMVGLGSYIVNAQAACVDCHSCPTYANSPFDDGEGEFNAKNYLAGGVSFGPEIVSANITPDEDGKPHGLDLDEFIEILRTGAEEDEPGHFLQVMPWPIFRNMTRRDLRAIYEYLSAIPHAEPGDCAGPGDSE